MANATVLDVAEDTDSAQPLPPTSFIYLALYYLSDDDVESTSKEGWPSDRLSWRLIPSKSTTIPNDRHDIFGIKLNQDSIVVTGDANVDDPTIYICAFIRLPIKPTKSYKSLCHQVQKCSKTLLSEAVDDAWQEWEWVYNMFEHLEVLEYLDDSVTNTWQYKDKSKMEIFKDRVLTLAKRVHEADGPPEHRVVDFPLGS